MDEDEAEDEDRMVDAELEYRREYTCSLKDVTDLGRGAIRHNTIGVAVDRPTDLIDGRNISLDVTVEQMQR